MKLYQYFILLRYGNIEMVRMSVRQYVFYKAVKLCAHVLQTYFSHEYPDFKAYSQSRVHLVLYITKAICTYVKVDPAAHVFFVVDLNDNSRRDTMKIRWHDCDVQIQGKGTKYYDIITLDKTDNRINSLVAMWHHVTRNRNNEK